MPPKGGYNKLTSYPPEYRDKVDRERKARVACVTRLAHLKRLKDTTTDEAKLQKLNDEIIGKTMILESMTRILPEWILQLHYLQLSWQKIVV